MHAAMKKFIITLFIASVALCSCTSFMDLRPTGAYTSDNVDHYPKLTRGYVEKAYHLLIASSSYLSNEYAYLDAATDDALFSLPSADMRRFASGDGILTWNPFSSYWSRDYQAIYYVNLFLKDNRGYNTQYLVDHQQDKELRNYLQGDAYGLRAWAYLDLLRKFGGVDEKGNLSGVCIMDEPRDITGMIPEDIVRSSYDACMQHILDDCDSALVYLPLANRDFALAEGESTYVGGGIRYKALDRVTVKCIKALAYLTWASPAFNPGGDKTRYAEAAKLAYEVIAYKRDVEGPQGFDPAARVQWTDKNSPEIIWRHDTDSKLYEESFYPVKFGGTADLVPSQNLVNAFPMANGFPIDDHRSGYNMSDPYHGRDPRFYSCIFYSGSSILRNGLAGSPMYTFDMSKGGFDAPGQSGTSSSGYYIKKFIFAGYNPYDATVSTQSRCVFAFRWTHALLMFAEAASQAYGPTDATLGMSARDAIASIRSRYTYDDEPGLGAKVIDFYLDECSASADKFLDLVKNEWRIETCFEGWRFYNVRRWAKSVDEINVPVYGASFNSSGYVNTRTQLYTLSFPSLSMPIPYTEFRKAPELLQNGGWESWK